MRREGTRRAPVEISRKGYVEGWHSPPLKGLREGLTFSPKRALCRASLHTQSGFLGEVVLVPSQKFSSGKLLVTFFKMWGTQTREIVGKTYEQ